MNEFTQKPKTGAKDFFLHFGAMVALYVSVGALISLLFSVIDYAFPRIGSYYGTPSISFQVAELLVIVPIFFVLSWLVHKTYAMEPEKRGLGVRRWLTFITLFITGAIVAGDLVYVLYLFLDGQNLTAGFILKALSILVVLGGIFGYYLQDLREKIDMRGHKLAAGHMGVVVIVSIIAGFMVIGSPASQRELRYDEQKVNDLSGIQSRVTSYYQQKGKLPASLADVSDALAYGPLPEDPQGKVYEYKKVADKTFELCATFNQPSKRGEKSMVPVYYDMYGGIENSIWDHGIGRTCFTRTVDPDFFPSVKPVIR